MSSRRILTANRLRDGAVVYLAPAGNWTELLKDAAVADDDEAATALERTGAAAERACVVVAPYLIDLDAAENGVRPARLREEIRAVGPTVRPDLARRQPEG